MRVWDGPTRAFHWLLALSLLSAWASYEFSERVEDHTLLWHRMTGYVVLTLIVFRVLWGFVGSSTARFRSFVRGPAAAAGYALDVVRGRDRHYLGHNPLGTFMVLALLGGMAAQATFGLFNSQLDDGTVSGPLSSLWSEPWVRFFRRWHRQGFNILLGLVAIHVTVNVLYELVRREPLIRAMVTGRKPAQAYVDAPEASIADNCWGRAALCLAIAATLVLGTLLAFGRNVL